METKQLKIKAAIVITVAMWILSALVIILN